MAERQQEMSPEPLVDDTVSPMTNTPPTPKHTSRLEVGGEDEEEGEDVMSQVDSSEDEGDDMEITEEDKKFIEDRDDSQEEVEGEDDEEETKQRKRKRRAIVVEDEDGDLDDEDMDLLNENLGLRKETRYKKLRKKGDQRREDEEDMQTSNSQPTTTQLENLFDDDDAAEPMAQGDDQVEVKKLKSKHDDFNDDLDDLDDFIIDDEEADSDDNKQELREAKLARREVKRELVKNMGITYGISDETWREIDDLFGDGSDYQWALDLDKMSIEDSKDMNGALMRGAQVEKAEVKLTDLYEPSEIHAKMLTEEDEVIRIKDIPERYQLLGDLPVYNEAEAITQTSFISNILANEVHASIPPAKLNEAVGKVIKYILHDHFEVPFIAAHRRDHVFSILDRTHLWRIFDILREFELVRIRHEHVSRIIDELATGAADDFVMEVGLVTRYRQYIKSAHTVVDIADVLASLQAKFGEAVASLETVRKVGVGKIYKRPGMRNLYQDARGAGLERLAGKYGVDVGMFATALKNAMPDSYVPETDLVMPEEAAKAFVCSAFPTVEMVLQGARSIIALEIASDPSIRQFVRKIFDSDALVSIFPTERGRLEIEENHPFYTFKYIREKPIHKFTDGQFLQIMAAEEQNLIKVEAIIGNSKLFENDVREAISSDLFSALGQEWNKERNKIIDMVMGPLLFPAIVKGLKEKLSADATSFVIAAATKQLDAEIDMTGWEMRGQMRRDNTPVLAMSWGDGERGSPLVCALLDVFGSLNDRVSFDRLHDMNKEGDLDRMKEYLQMHSVELIVMSGSAPNTRTRLYEDVRRVVEEGRMDVEVMIVDDNVAKIYADSKRGQKEFPGEYIVRYCVSLGRRALDPTMEFAGLCNADDDVMLLHLHPLQGLVPVEKLRKSIERSFCNIVNSIGVDVNLAVMYPHKAHTLQFVCGLGPRKAPTMLNKISRISNGGRLESREMLVKKGICSKQIFMNSASFLRIKAVHFQRRQGEESLLDVLDDTRIHPEDYGLARKMAADSIEVDEELDEEENPSLHVQDLMEGDVNRLDSLLLDDYADELERRLGEPKRIALNEIKDELKQPYRERRRRFTPPSVDRVFTMLTGMTDETLRRDMLIACRVERVTDRVVRVVVGSGLDGFIYAKNLSDNGSMGQTPADHGVYEGKVLKCRVVEVQKDKLSVELSARPSEVEYGANEEVRRDECFDYKCEKKDAMEREAKVRSVVVGRKEISVSHPKFVKCGSEEAERMMEGKEVGWYLLRPSGKGPRHLSVTWKVAVGRACHLDVVDMGGGGKMGWSIDNRKFGELDELLVVYLDPLIRNVREVLECAKFSGRERNAMLGVLKGDTETFRKSSYGICGSEDPLKFYFCYCNVGGRGKYDHLIVRPEGFMFRERVYGRVSEVIVGFKKGEERRARERSAGRGGGRNGEARSGARPDERRRR